MSIHIFGVRHHGPGCARSLRAALQQLEPDIVLVEGPPDGQEILPLLTHNDMQPPVAMLIYAPEQPARAVYYPFTHFSPEWQALHYALAHCVPARFMDLPQAIQLAQEPEQPAAPAGTEPPAPHSVQATRGRSTILPAPLVAPIDPRNTTNTDLSGASFPPDDDPLAMLACAVGYSDHELWWEQQIEQRHDTTGLFEGILEAMTALRTDKTPKNGREAQREAHMRQVIRMAQQEGFQRIAVVCGAWHSPVLSDLDTNATTDAVLLNALKRINVAATWIPWTNSRLAYRSGYGAGVSSPGWYEHLWAYTDQIAIRWISHAAHLLRKEELDASSASVIEAVRLADALAAMRDLPMPGMAELHQSIETVLCHGNETPMQLIRDRLEIGERLGEVPAETPAVPLQRDLEIKQRRLRLKPSAEIIDLDIDLREETGRARSQLLHQLRLLGIEWGQPQHVSTSKRGTFHERWKVQWHVEFVVRLIEANIWGNTVEAAAMGLVRHQADTATDLPALTDLLRKTILAELPEAVEHVLTCVQARAAVSADVRHMMDALPPLTHIARYSDVRQTKAERIMPVIDGLFERMLVGLPAACTSLDDESAAAMVGSINNVQNSLNTLDRVDQQQAWHVLLRRLVDSESMHGLVRGRCCRLLLDQQVIDDEEVQRLACLALSTVNPPAQAAAWIEGVLTGSAQLLLNQKGLWLALDVWLSELTPDNFIALLPLLRRGFSGFQKPERRKMGEIARHLRKPQAAGLAGAPGSSALKINQERAALVLPILAHILGGKV